MKKRNILKRCKNGWLIGLDDENNVIVQSPEGYVGEPHRVFSIGEDYCINGPMVQQSAHGQDKGVVIKVPLPVMIVVRRMWEKQQRIAALQSDIDEAEERGGAAPTLGELGFDGNPRVSDF